MRPTGSTPPGESRCFRPGVVHLPVTRHICSHGESRPSSQYGFLGLPPGSSLGVWLCWAPRACLHLHGTESKGRWTGASERPGPGLGQLVLVISVP